jgi:hypothetical protein
MKKLFILFAIFTLGACEKVVIPDDNSSKKAIFEEFWSDIDENYSLFQFTDLNWDSIKNVYQGKISNTMSDEAFYDTLCNMAFELKDAHTNIYPLNTDIILKSYDYFRESEYPRNYNFSVISNKYVYANDYVVVYDHYAYCWLGNTKIGYMVYNEYFDENTTEEAFVKMLEYFSGCKGIIIDIRENGGGNNAISQMMLSHLSDTKHLVGYIKTKNGKGHNDFSSWTPRYIEPASPNFNYKIILLTNRLVYSTANEMVMWAKAFSNITSVGGTTGGGIGIPVKHMLNNGWAYRTSASIESLPNGTIYPNGTPPDSIVTTYYAENKDDIIETAINMLQNQ